jgi:hypothetical protein
MISYFKEMYKPDASVLMSLDPVSASVDYMELEGENLSRHIILSRARLGLLPWAWDWVFFLLNLDIY